MYLWDSLTEQQKESHPGISRDTQKILYVCTRFLSLEKTVSQNSCGQQEEEKQFLCVVYF